MSSKKVTSASIVDDINTFIRSFDVTSNSDLELINMLSRAREIVIRADGIIYAREHPEEAHAVKTITLPLLPEE